VIRPRFLAATIVTAVALSAVAGGVMLVSRSLPSRSITEVQALSEEQRSGDAESLDGHQQGSIVQLALRNVMASRHEQAASALAAARDEWERLSERDRAIAGVLSPFVKGDLDSAKPALDEALTHHPDSAELHLIAAKIGSACGHFDPNGMVEHLERALAIEAGNESARLDLAAAYSLKGMRDWILSRASERRAQEPRGVAPIAEMGRARIARGEYGDAIEAADEVVRHGQDVFAHGLAPAFILAGHHDQVVAMYDPEMERTNTEQANVLTHLHAGVNDVWLGRLEKAREHFERGAEFQSAPWQESGRALFQLLAGRALGLQGREREARSAFAAAGQAVGEEPVIEYCLGLSHIQAGEIEQAREVLDRLEIERRPSRPGWSEPWRRLLKGEVSLMAGEPTRAMDEFRQAWRLQRPLAVDCVAGHTAAYFLDALGRGYLATRRHQDALDAFEQIRALGLEGLRQPEISVMALYQSGLALEALGRADEARARYRQFLQLWGEGDLPSSRTEGARAKLAEIGG